MIAMFLFSSFLSLTGEVFYPVTSEADEQKILKHVQPDEPKPCYGQVEFDLETGEQKCLKKRCFYEGHDKATSCYDLEKPKDSSAHAH